MCLVSSIKRAILLQLALKLIRASSARPLKLHGCNRGFPRGEKDVQVLKVIRDRPINQYAGTETERERGGEGSERARARGFFEINERECERDD